MLEALILSICISSSNACSASLRAYYQTPTPTTEKLKAAEKRLIRAYKQEPALEVLAPILGVAVKGEATIKITGKISTKISSKSAIAIYSISF